MATTFKLTPVYRCALVREGSTKTAPKLNSAAAAGAVAVELLKDSPQEQFVVIMLDTKLKVIGATVVTIGTLDASLVHPREVFRPAIIANSSAIILAHNHPSGDTTPSREDIDVTDTLKNAGRMLGIQVCDHLVVNADGDFTSIETYRQR